MLPLQNKVNIALLIDEYYNFTKNTTYSRHNTIREIMHQKKFILPKFNNYYGIRNWKYLLPSIMHNKNEEFIFINTTNIINHILSFFFKLNMQCVQFT